MKAELIPFYTFGLYITPEEAIERGDTRTLAELKEQAKINAVCENCENPIWRYGTGDLCFPCVTGETDASEDCELKYQP